jgi:hypothetical protein
MKSKSAWAFVGIGVIALLGLIILPQQRRTVTEQQPRGEIAVQNTEMSDTQGAQENTTAAQVEAEAIRSSLTGTKEVPDKAQIDDEDPGHKAHIQARIAELEELARKENGSSLEILLSEVRNPEKEIRQAALDAITQSGNRDAIPRLVELASQVEDMEDKRVITEAADFLKLPTITEVISHTASRTNNTPPVAKPADSN